MNININGVQITLTADQLKQIDEQVKQQEKERAMPTTWEECMQRHLDSKGTTYYVNSNNISRDNISISAELRGNSCLSERRAKQIAAAIKLSVIVDTLNGGLWVPELGEEFFALEIKRGDDLKEPVIEVDNYFNWQLSLFYIKSEEIAEYILEHFKDLLNDYFMLEN